MAVEPDGSRLVGVGFEVLVTKRAPGSLAKAGKGKDRPALLRALLEKLTETAESADPSDLPGLARQINAVSKDLASLPSDEKSVVDDIAAKRAKRRAKTAR